MKAVVVGGGIGGLTSAFRILQRHPGAQVTLCEAGPQLGGVIQGEHGDGLTLEFGPDAMIRTKPAGLALVKELGLEGRILDTMPDARRALVAKGNRLLPVPEGLYLMAPGRWWPFLCSPLISWRGKLRMGLDLLLPRGPGGDESLGSFVRRRLGREALARIAQPLVGGIYTADPERLSLAATMPMFLEMERTHRSLLLGMRARTKAQASQASAAGARYGLFMSLDGGLSTLTNTLVERLKTAGASLRTGLPAHGLERRAEGGWRVLLGAGGMLDADVVVLALPAHAAAPLCAGIDAELGARLAAIPYAGVATVNLLYDADRVPAPPMAAGFVVPAIEGRSLVAATFSNRKFPNRIPTGLVGIRAFVGGALHERQFERDDSQILRDLAADLKELCGIAVEPKRAVVTRWPKAMAQHLVGHLDTLRVIRSREAALPGLFLVGNGYEGVGIPDIIAQTERIALA